MSAPCDRRGLALVEVLGAAVLLGLLGLLAASQASAQLVAVARERQRERARTLLDDLEARLLRVFAAAPASATELDWHAAGIAATLSVPAAGTTSHPLAVTGLSPTAPRWRAFPAGQPRRVSAGAALYQEGGAAWELVDPGGGDAELAPPAPGWDVNENGVCDRPDVHTGGARRQPALLYTIDIGAPAATGDPYIVVIRVYGGLAARAHTAGPPEMAGAELLLERRLSAWLGP